VPSGEQQGEAGKEQDQPAHVQPKPGQQPQQQHGQDPEAHQQLGREHQQIGQHRRLQLLDQPEVFQAQGELRGRVLEERDLVHRPAARLAALV